jgi:hypothetical protein
VGRQLGWELLWLGVIVALIFLNWVIFRAFRTNYLVWYLHNGALISIIFGFVALAGADPNQRIDLISLSPRRYLAACLSLSIWPELATSAALDSGAFGRSVLLNAVLLIPLSLCLLAAMWVFLFVAVPLQYFVYAVCGAPGRAVHESAASRSYWLVEGDKVKIQVLRSPKGELPKELADLARLRNLRDNIASIEESAKSEGSIEAQAELARLRTQADQELSSLHVQEVEFEDQPVKLTAAFASLVLWIAGQFVH